MFYPYRRTHDRTFNILSEEKHVMCMTTLTNVDNLDSCCKQAYRTQDDPHQRNQIIVYPERDAGAGGMVEVGTESFTPACGVFFKLQNQT